MFSHSVTRKGLADLPLTGSGNLVEVVKSEEKLVTDMLGVIVEMCECVTNQPVVGTSRKLCSKG